MQSMETDVGIGASSSSVAGPSAGTSSTQIPASMPPFNVPLTGAQKRNIPSGPEDPPPVHTRTRLHDLVKEIDPNERLSEEVEDVLLELADDFIEATVKAACLSAKHRKSNIIEVKDVQLHLERDWNMWLPGFGMEEIRPYTMTTESEAHKRRMELIRKAVKK